jgi:hypothetical protein
VAQKTTQRGTDTIVQLREAQGCQKKGMQNIPENVKRRREARAALASEQKKQD